MATKKKQQKPESTPIYIWFILFFVGFIIIGSILHSNDTQLEPNFIKFPSQENDSFEDENSKSSITYTITQTTFAATCEECFDEMYIYFKDNDEQAIRSMMDEGKIKVLGEGQILYLVDGSLTHAVLREKGSTERLWVVNSHIKKN